MEPRLAHPRAMTDDELVDAMARFLFCGAVDGTVDLGDERSVDACLAKANFPAAKILVLDQRAVALAQAKKQRRATILDLGDKAADVVAIGFLVSVWTVGYCLLCPPARAAQRAAADALVTDVSIAWFLPVAPLLIILLIGFVWLCRERRGPAADPWDEDEQPFFRCPPNAPNLASLEQIIRREEGR